MQKSKLHIKMQNKSALKFEARNPKFETNPNVQIFKNCFCFGYLDFGHLKIVLRFRYSDFGFLHFALSFCYLISDYSQ
jgi:hypothetical protein